jgi:hypothetical protein
VTCGKFAISPNPELMEERAMLDKRTGIIVAVIAAALIATLIVYGLGINGEEAAGVNEAVKP